MDSGEYQDKIFGYLIPILLGGVYGGVGCLLFLQLLEVLPSFFSFPNSDSEEIDRKRARVKNSEGGDVPQKYFVVTNNQLLRVKYLLVYSQKQHRR